jgi:hypothetical protein
VVVLHGGLLLPHLMAAVMKDDLKNNLKNRIKDREHVKMRCPESVSD